MKFGAEIPQAHPYVSDECDPEAEVGEYFKTKDELNRVMRAFLSKASVDSLVGPHVTKTNMIVCLSYSDPDATVTLHLGDPDYAATGHFITFEIDDEKPVGEHKDADVEISMPSDFAHRFWLGMENLGVAIINGKIRAAGNYIKALALLPAIKPLFRTYKETLKELGLSHLILSDSG